MTDVAFPFRFSEAGRTATAGSDRHVVDLIEQVLFTTPGERVNNPDFGCGLLQLVFAPNSDERAAATQYLIQSALQEWLGDVIKVEEVSVVTDEAVLRVTVAYTALASGQSGSASFARPGAGP